MALSLRAILSAALSFYSFIIIAYVILTWFPVTGAMEDVFRVLASVVEPYLNIFRRIIPNAGGLDFSPFVAILVIWAIQTYVIRFIP